MLYTADERGGVDEEAWRANFELLSGNAEQAQQHLARSVEMLEHLEAASEDVREEVLQRMPVVDAEALAARGVKAIDKPVGAVAAGTGESADSAVADVVSMSTPKDDKRARQAARKERKREKRRQ